MFYLEVVLRGDEGEQRCGEICSSLAAVREALSALAWVRFVIRELPQRK